MEFWFFMLFLVASLPLAILIIGIIFFNRPPKNINFFLGYRTDLSMKNAQTWEFANRLLGKIWLILGAALLPVMCVPMFFVMKSSEHTIGVLAAILASVSLLPIIFSGFFVEIQLKKNFTPAGKRKKDENNKN